MNTDIDLSDTIAPNSDQLGADDLIAGPRTVTITDVSKALDGATDQPINIHLAEFPGRAWRPSKGMRRILIEAWGPKASAYIGQRVTLYRDPAVKWAGERVGGIRISHLSGIDKRLDASETVARGKKVTRAIQPLSNIKSASDWHAEADALDDLTALGDLWRAAPAEVRPYITERAAVVRESQTPASAKEKSS